MSTVRLNPMQIPEDVARLPVQLIRVTVHTLGYAFDDDERSGNHASIYIVTGGTSSIQLNMVKDGPTAVMGTYKVIRCEYETSNSALQNFDMKARGGLTVGDVTSLIIRLGRHKYKLDRSGLGCRYWVQTVVKDFEIEGYVDFPSKPSPGDVMGYLEYNYHKEKSPEFTEIARGTFVN